MSGPKKEIRKLSEQGVITEEALLAYLRNELTETEKQEMERLLPGDDFAREALEGLRTSGNNASVAGTLITVRKRVRDRIGLKERKTLSIHWTSYAWAAVVLGLLIGLGFILVNYASKRNASEIAINTKKAKEEKPAPVIPQQPAASSDSAVSGKKETIPIISGPAVTSITAPASGPPGATGKNSTAIQPNQNSTITAKGAPVSTGATALSANSQARPSTGIATNMLAGKAVPSPSSGMSNNAANNIQARKAASPKEASTAAAAPMTVTTEKADKKTEAEMGKMEVAMKNFNSGDYKKASNEFDKILKREPDNPDALYFGGISDYIDNKTAKSEAQFDKLLKKGDKYTDGSKWYKANILLKKGDTEHAKSLLQELSNTNNPYKERALKKMSEMGF